jgi:dihydrofolate reductase
LLEELDDIQMIALIAAIDDAGGIGKDGKLPWSFPEDLKRFKHITLGHPVVMGRKTFESIGKPLTGRANYILTRDRNYRPVGPATTVPNFKSLLEIFSPEEDVFIIGGAAVYREALPYAHVLYVTRIPGTYDCDTFFPEVDWSAWDMSTSMAGEPGTPRYETWFPKNKDGQ